MTNVVREYNLPVYMLHRQKLKEHNCNHKMLREKCQKETYKKEREQLKQQHETSMI